MIFCKHPSMHGRSLSHLYSLFETSLMRKKSNHRQVNDENAPELNVVERPLNVFHMLSKNDTSKRIEVQVDEKRKDLKSGRVEILSKRRRDGNCRTSEKIPSQNVKSTDTQRPHLTKLSVKKEGKLFLKKLEFEFKWMNLNSSSAHSREVVDVIVNVLGTLKESLQKEIQNFDIDKKLITKNLHVLAMKPTTVTTKKIDSNKKLIEEI